MNRLFVPLNTGPFLNFKNKSKKYELRSYGRAYTEKHVYKDRKVELRKGYSGESLFGTIGKVLIGDLGMILKKINYKLIIPDAKSIKEAKERINKIMKKKEKYIAFEVILRKK